MSKKNRSPQHSQALATSAEQSNKFITYGKWLVLSPAQLKSSIDSFNKGDYSQVMKTIQTIFNNDAQIKTCLEKRIAFTTGARWDVVALENGSKEEVAQQMEVVRDFYNNMCVNATDALDANGGFSDLLRFLMLALVYRYSACAIAFSPARTPSGRATYHASFMTSPLHNFDAQAKKLRLAHSNGQTKALNGDWAIAFYDNPLCASLLCLHFFKAVSEVDWGVACEKFGTPFVAVKTSAQKGTAEWEQAKAIAGSIGANYNVVLGNDLSLVIEKLAQGGAPHKDLIDYFDRAIARLILGGDLDTMSREGSAVGSLAQTTREDYLRQSDKTWLENIIDNNITKPLLKRVFPNSRQLVYLSLSSQNERNLDQLSRSVDIAMRAGLQIPKSWLYESLGIPAPVNRDDVINEEKESKRDLAIKRIGRAQVKQMLPILESLDKIRRAKTEKEAFLATTQLRQTFDQKAQEVLTKTDMAETLSQEVAKSVENPLDALKPKIEKELEVEFEGVN